MNIKSQNKSNLSVFDRIYMRKESLDYNYICTFLILELFFNGKDGLAGHLDYEY